MMLFEKSQHDDILNILNSHILYYTILLFWKSGIRAADLT